jgi:hypothetical protein
LLIQALRRYYSDSTAQVNSLNDERGRLPSLVHTLKQLAKITTKIDQQLFVKTPILPGLSTHLVT